MRQWTKGYRRFTAVGLGLSLFLLLSQCSTPKTLVQPQRPEEFYGTVPENKISSFRIPVSIPLEALESFVNTLISGVIYEDTQTEGDNLTIKVEKDGAIKFTPGGQVVNYSVPLKIKAVYHYNIAFIQGSKELDFKLTIQFATKLAIGKDWKAISHTSYNGFTWISEPTIDLGVMKFNASHLLGGVIDKQGDVVSGIIDQNLRDHLDIKSMADHAWETIQQPSKVSNEFRLWVKVLPQAISSTPLVSKGKLLNFDFSVTAFTKTFVGKPKETGVRIPLPFPSDSLLADTGFAIHMATEIPFYELDTLANQLFANKEYSFNDGKQKITVEKLNFYGSGYKMIVEAKVKGSINGTLYLTSSPIIDSVSQALRLKNIAFDIKTKDVLVKSAAWLLDNRIEKQIEKAFVFDLKPIFQETKSQIQGVLKSYKINENMVMKGQVTALYPQKLYMRTDLLDIRTVAKGQLHIFVNQLK